MVNKFGNGTGAKSGFTLLELLVTMAIFAIITSVVVVNFRTSRHSDTLRLAAASLASQLREIQSMAQTGRVTESCQDDRGLQRAARGGYGAQVSGGAIVFFANCEHGNRGYVPESRELAGIEFRIPSGVTIEMDADLTVLFEPPRPEIFINAARQQSEARIALRHEISGEQRTILIRRLSGVIEIE